MDYTAYKPVWWIAHGKNVGSGFLKQGQTLSTGAQFFETFSDETKFQRRLYEIETDPLGAFKSGGPTDLNRRLGWLRWRKETGGITMPNGMEVYTTREVQAQLVGTLSSFSLGLISGEIDWKSPNGWVKVNETAVLSIAQAVSIHVQRCFAAEKLASDEMNEIENLSLMDIDELFDKHFEALA